MTDCEGPGSAVHRAEIGHVSTSVRRDGVRRCIGGEARPLFDGDGAHFLKRFDRFHGDVLVDDEEPGEA